MRIFIFMAVLLAAACLIIIYHDTHTFRVVRYALTSPKLTKALRAVVLADLHDTRFGEHNEQLSARVRQLSPDLVLVAGDMVTSSRNPDFSGAEDLLISLAGEFPVYYGMGNHETRMAADPKEHEDVQVEEYRKRLSRAGVVFLQNESVKLRDYPVTLHGLELENEYYHKRGRRSLTPEDLTEKLGKADPQTYHLLIAHNPEYFPQYSDWHADLVVSGHVHGGIVRLPVLGGVISTSFRLFPKYDGGLFMEGNSAMVISRGLGSHTIPVRMFNPGECVVIDLQPGEITDGHICKAGEI
ncbi:MAG: metallophosphoesterase [Lachnospiraceae bacterium]|nr:metallophosphoesterase [Lachnospiraceae bacterium]